MIRVDHWLDAAFKKGAGWTDARTGKKLSLPGVPAVWTDVQYNASPGRPRIARGLNTEGNPAVVYDPVYRQQQARLKWGRVDDLLSRYNQVVQRNGARMSKTKDDTPVVAALVLDTGIRPGQPYKRGKKIAYGATTLQARHVLGGVKDMWLSFQGKKGVHVQIPVMNTRVAAYLDARRRKLAPTDRLFNTTAAELSAYTKQLVGKDTAKTKDFRTALGTALAVETLSLLPAPQNEKEAKKFRTQIGTAVGSRLGHTNPGMSLNNYIDPKALTPLQYTNPRMYAAELRKVQTAYGSTLPHIQGRLHRAKSGKLYHVLPNGSWSAVKLWK